MRGWDFMVLKPCLLVERALPVQSVLATTGYQDVAIKRCQHSSQKLNSQAHLGG